MRYITFMFFLGICHYYYTALKKYGNIRFIVTFERLGLESKIELMGETAWIVYILICGDNTLYTGITKNIKKRLKKHEAGVAAKYTRGRGPFKVVYTEVFNSKSDALRRELDIKKLSRIEKLKIIRNPLET